MAKYNFNNKLIDCNLLNESKTSYLVEFKNGHICEVDKDNITDINIIDEGVLDFVKTKMGNMWNKLFKAGKSGNSVVILDEKNNVIPVVPPVNTANAAKNLKCVELCALSPSTKSVVANFGLNIKNKISQGIYSLFNGKRNISDEKLYIVPMDEYIKRIDITSTNESELQSFYNILSEDYIYTKGEYGAKSERDIEKLNQTDDSYKFVYRRGKDFDKEGGITMTMFAEFVERDYDKLCKGLEVMPMLVLGAPGIAKTATVRSFAKQFKADLANDNLSFDLIIVTAGDMRPDDMNLPFSYGRTIKYQRHDENGNSIGEPVDVQITEVSDTVKSWLPSYDMNAAAKRGPEFVEIMNDIANGGHDIYGGYDTTKYGTSEWIRGGGGILFLDEFTRASESVRNSFMQLLGDRIVGVSNFKLGDRWLVICAGNRMDDIPTVDDMPAVAFQNAHGRRVNYKPIDMTFEEWVENFASQPDPFYNDPDITNVLPEIIDFLKSDFGETCYYAYEVPKDMTNAREFVSNMQYKATPASWTHCSDDIRTYLLKYSGVHYDEVYKGILPPGYSAKITGDEKEEMHIFNDRTGEFVSPGEERDIMERYNPNFMASTFNIDGRPITVNGEREKLNDIAIISKHIGLRSQERLKKAMLHPDRPENKQLIDYCTKFKEVRDIPKELLTKICTPHVGYPIALKFATYVTQFTVCPPELLRKVWVTKDAAELENLVKTLPKSAFKGEYILTKEVKQKGKDKDKPKEETLTTTVSLIQLISRKLVDFNPFDGKSGPSAPLPNGTRPVWNDVNPFSLVNILHFFLCLANGAAVPENAGIGEFSDKDGKPVNWVGFWCFDKGLLDFFMALKDKYPELYPKIVNENNADKEGAYIIFRMYLMKVLDNISKKNGQVDNARKRDIDDLKARIGVMA